MPVLKSPEKSIFIIICPVIVILVQAFIFTPNCSADSHLVLQLAWKHQFQFAGYYAALDQGYYRDAGLKVTIVEGGEGRFACEEVMAGRAQFGIAGSELILHRQEGNPFVVLAAVFQHSPSILLARNDTGISHPRDLIGKRVMLLPGKKDADILAVFLNEGIDLNAVTRVDHTYHLQDLIERRIEAVSAYLTNEPWYLEQMGVTPKIILPQTYGVDFYSDCLFTVEAEIRNHPERVQHFLDASLRGWEYALGHTDETIELIQGRYSVQKSKAHLRYEADAIKQIIQPTLVQLGHMNPGRWQHIADTYVALGMLDPEYSLEGFLYQPDPEKNYTWIKWITGIATFIIVVVGIVAGILLFSNRQLRIAIEERKKAETARWESEEQFRKLIEQSPIVYEMYDKNGIQRMVNKAYGRLWEIDPQSTVDHFNIWETGQIDTLRPHLKQAYAGEVVVLPEMYWDFRKEVGQGRDRWISSIIYPLFDRQGEVDAIVILHEDITDKRLAHEALRESEEKFRNFAEQSLVGIYLVQDGILKYVNPKFAEIHGYTVEECLDNMPVITLTHPQDIPIVNKNIRKRLSGEISSVHYIFRGMKKNGDFIHGEVFGSTTIYNGRPAAIGTFLDITEKVETENNLRQARKMEAVGTLAGGIAHEFNNVLGIIIGNTELAIEDLQKWNPTQRNLNEIKKASLRAKDVVQQLLNFSRKDATVKKTLDLIPIVNESLRLMRASIPTTIDIQSHIPDTVYPVIADSTQIHQIIFNLCTNAFHAMSSEGGRLDILLENLDLTPRQAGEYGDLAQGAYVHLQVSDTGHGIDHSLLDKIFDPYFTTKEFGKGSGMGLAVIHGIVKAHSGVITVKSTVGEGTTFDILLPAGASAEPEDSHDALKKEYPKGRERILLVDDEPSLVETGKELLSHLGYRVRTQTNPLDALELFRANPQDFDLVISDMTMPRMTGDKLAREFLAIRPGIPIIICTGYSEKMDKTKARLIGIREYVDKPINLKNISRIVRNVLDRSV